MRAPFGSFSSVSKVPGGSAAKAESIGPNTVYAASGLFSVSTRPAALTPATKVVNSGLFEAAVPTGALTMPSGDPGPVFGTAEQDGPKMSLTVVTPVPDAELDELDEPEALEELGLDELGLEALVVAAPPVVVGLLLGVWPLLQAAMVRVSAPSAPTAASR